MQFAYRFMIGILILGLPALNELSVAQEWTRFRGPNGTGISDAQTIPVDWTDQDYNWKVKLPAGGNSSPVLWGKKIFLTGADDADTARQTVFSLDANDGKVLWSRDFDSQPQSKHKLNSYAAATPAVDQEHVYVVWSTPAEYVLLALDHNGKDVWRRNLGPFLTIQGDGCSPIVYEDLVVLPVEQEAEKGGISFIIAVDRKTGETRWQLPRTSASCAYSTPCVYRLNEGPTELIFNSTAHGIFAVDAQTGLADWAVEKLFTKRSCSSPVVISGGDRGDLIVGTCGSGGGGNYLVVVHPGSPNQPDSGKLAYKLDKNTPYVPTPIAKGDRLYLWGDKGIVSCVNAFSGEMIWQKRVGGDVYGSPICVANRLYCISSDGDVNVVAASDDYEFLGKHPLEEFSRCTPAVAGGCIYFRTYQHLFSLGGKKPNQATAEIK